MTHPTELVPPLTIGAAVAFLDARYRLTVRQKDVARLLLLGRCDKEIATELGISVDTVRYHCTELFRRLRVQSRLEVVTCLFRPETPPAEQ